MPELPGLAGSAIPIMHLFSAMVAGGAIGLERTFHGRAAGFRTYALVCMGSTMAMIVAIFPNAWLGAQLISPADATRIVQGILTGIGFLGAGVIVKYGFSIHGLTTAASIWVTAVVGILIGAKFYWEAMSSVLLVLGALSICRWIENRLNKESYIRVNLSVSRISELSKPEIDSLIAQAGLTIERVCYGLEQNRTLLDYEYTLSTRNNDNLSILAKLFASHSEIEAFNISPGID